ncbi:hypothetical protein [Agromyces sp. NPDC058110]|uniref:hypothetical protein n=1 Tax=Agromyces sp. NPDC058110 TaxID=3346345 RepID=UPI0036DC9DC0
MAVSDSDDLLSDWDTEFEELDVLEARFVVAASGAPAYHRAPTSRDDRSSMKRNNRMRAI